MSNMSHCRHHNTYRDLAEVWDLWEDGASNDGDAAARKRLVELVREMHEQFDFDGTYDEVDGA